MPSQIRPDDQGHYVTDDELTQMVAAELNPPWNNPVTPTPAEAMQIVRRAHEHRRRNNRLRMRTAITVIGSAATAAAIIAVATLGAAIWPQAKHSPDVATRPPTRAVAEVISLPDPASWQPARAALTSLAQSVRGLREPQPAGRYTYNRTLGWSIDTTAADPHEAITAYEEQCWWAHDGSGREAIADLGDWTPGTDPGPPRPADPRKDRRYTHGMHVVIPDLSDDVLVLSGQLAGHQDPTDGPQATLRAVRDVYRFHAPSPKQRSALLQALADTDGLRIAGAVDGGAGRRGLAVVVDSDTGATRDIAIINPSDGRMLAYDTVALIGLPGVHLQTPAVTDSVLFVSQGHTDHD